MRLFPSLVLALTATSLAATPALAAPRGLADGLRMALNERPRDQDRAFRATQQGRAMPLPQLMERVLPHVDGANYIGSELKRDTTRLKFMQDGRVIWVDVDAGTGRIVRRSGN